MNQAGATMRMPSVPPRPYDRRSSGITPGLRNGRYIGAFEAYLPLSRSDTAAVVRTVGLLMQVRWVTA